MFSVYRIVETPFHSCFFAFYPFTTAPVPKTQNKVYIHPMHKLLVDQNIYIAMHCIVCNIVLHIYKLCHFACVYVEESEDAK